jgi:hypothetical protein
MSRTARSSRPTRAIVPTVSAYIQSIATASRVSGAVAALLLKVDELAAV